MPQLIQTQLRCQSQQKVYQNQNMTIEFKSLLIQQNKQFKAFLIKIMGNCNDKRSQRTYIDPSTLNQTDIDRLENGKPIHVSQGLNVKKNSKTNKLEGVPIEWAKKYKLPMEVDMEKTVDTKHLPRQIRPSGQLPKTITDFIQNKQSVIVTGSKISSYHGRMSSKLSVDHKAKYGIKNLPDELLQQIQLSQLSQQQVFQPQNLIELISIQDQPLFQSKHQSKLLTTNQFQKYLSKVKITPQNPAQRFDFLQQIGKGSMCKVYRACSKLNSLILYAVKIIKLDETRTIQKIKQQIAAMQMCYSENIIDYHFTLLYKESLFMFMEYMEYGSLTKFIHYYRVERNEKIPEGVIAYIVFEILKGLGCVHNRWQIHRDLKSDNILINKKGEVKISDFGYALQFTKEKTASKDVVGTPAWMAPELIMKKDYTESVDIWSLGIIITQLVNGQPKYLRMKPLKAMYMIVSEEPPRLENVSFELKAFLNQCLQKDPQRRGSIKQLMNDPFIKNVDNMQGQKEKFKKMLIQSQQR